MEERGEQKGRVGEEAGPRHRYEHEAELPPILYIILDYVSMACHDLILNELEDLKAR